MYIKYIVDENNNYIEQNTLINNLKDVINNPLYKDLKLTLDDSSLLPHIMNDAIYKKGYRINKLLGVDEEALIMCEALRIKLGFYS